MVLFLVFFVGLLYAIGGCGQERLNAVEVFNQKEKKWYLVGPILCKRR